MHISYFFEEHAHVALIAIVTALLISLASPIGSAIKASVMDLTNTFGGKTSELVDNTVTENYVSSGSEPLTKEQAQLLGIYVAEDGEVFSSLEDLLIYQSQNEYLTCFVFADITGNELDDFLDTNNLPNQLQNLIIDNDTIALNEGIETNNLNISTGTLTLNDSQISNSEITAENVVVGTNGVGSSFVNNVVNVSSTANLRNSNLENTVVNAHTAGVVLDNSSMYNSVINLGNNGYLSVNGNNTMIFGTISEVFPYTGSINNSFTNTNRILLYGGTYTDPELCNMTLPTGYEIIELQQGNTTLYSIRQTPSQKDELDEPSDPIPWG